MESAETQERIAGMVGQLAAERRRAAWWRHRALLWRRVAGRYRRWMHRWRRAGDELRDVAGQLREAQRLIAMMRDALGAGNRNLLEVATERGERLRLALGAPAGVPLDSFAAELQAGAVGGMAKVMVERDALDNAVAAALEQLDGLHLSDLLVPGAEREELREALRGIHGVRKTLRAALDIVGGDK